MKDFTRSFLRAGMNLALQLRNLTPSHKRQRRAQSILRTINDYERLTPRAIGAMPGQPAN